ncbi:imidazolonepropionase [Advenella kashmirensis]|uniref:imidazolonepropionase n=1 Tax=Advenella kashmirensis TaxID=310575 RepID=UPI001C11506F|nr:imidazolonepropionase [Advenella kashmirensis]
MSTHNSFVLERAKIATWQEGRFSVRDLHDVHIENGLIRSVLPSATGPSHPDDVARIDVQGQLVTPGLIDCHTHLVFGGNRAAEWSQRQRGVSYQDIAEQGGGINSTVRATRQATEDELLRAAVPRLRNLMSEGVTTLESKTGYGLSLEHERKQLQVMDLLQTKFPVEIVKTLLCAHTLPPEYKNRPDDFINLICTEIIPTLAREKAFESVDVFCETVGFNLEQTRRVFVTARALGFPVKGHTEQLSNSGGTQLVTAFHGLSADHLEYLDSEGVNALQRAGTVAVLLPFAFYFLGETQKPPVDLLREHHVPIAVATDFNPGTAPFASLRWAMNMACVQFGLTVEEVWAGVTYHAALALNRADRIGRIAPGYQADLLVWQTQDPADIVYEQGQNFLKQRYFKGKSTLA